MAAPNVNDVLDGHVSLDVECLDRIYLNAYVPNLQVSGQVVTFLTEHLGNPIPSPALFQPIGNRFRSAVYRWAWDNDVPVVRFKRGDRKAQVMAPYLDAADRPGVVAVGVAQEFQSVFVGYDRAKAEPGPPRFAFEKADRRVTVFYFYVRDDDFGPGFIKICTYFPYPAKVWVNGHEWAKQQCRRAGIAFDELSNGFASCDEPARLQAICDRLGPNQILTFFEHWMRHIPTPLDNADRAAGYWWELSMRQIETSRTLVLDQPRHARGFFESVIADNLALGRPDEITLVFARRVQKNTPSTFKTKVVNRGTDVTMNIFYKHSRVKQYLKDNRAMRIETVINSPTDIGVQRRLHNLDELQTKSRAINQRLIETECVGQDCPTAPSLFERVQQPYVREGQRTGALRFGDIRVMALAGALTVFVNIVTGFTNRSLRALIAGLLDRDYTANQMTYDLRRLRHHGLIEREHHTRTYRLTPDGQRWAIFTTKLHDRLLKPLLDAHRPPAPPELRSALRTIDHHINTTIQNAHIKAAA